MAVGKVKWFNNAKGYGFILAEDEKEDLFVHYTSIQMEGYKTLKAGQIVHFDTIKVDKGFHAINITSEESPIVEVNIERLKSEDESNHLEIV